MNCRPGPAAARLRGNDHPSLLDRVVNSMGSNKPRRRTVDDELTHPLLGDLPTLQLLTPRDEVGARAS